MLFNRIFRRRKPKHLRGDVNSGDMRTNAVDNPFDLREDGSIHKGDPAWDAMWEALSSCKATYGNQRPDGTWDVKQIKDE